MLGPTLVILAAGTRSRYDGLKTFDPVGPDGEAVMDYSVFDAHRAGFKRFVFVIRPDLEKVFRERVQKHLVRHVAVDYVFQKMANLPAGFHVPPGRVRPWGTTHAVLAAETAIHEPFGLINCDDFYGAESYRTLADYLKTGPVDQAMVGFTLRNTLPEMGPVARAVCAVNQDGWLERITECKHVEREGGHARSCDPEGHEERLDGGALVSMNMWGFTPAVFEALRSGFAQFLRRAGSHLEAESCIPEVVGEMVAEKRMRVRVLRCADAWFGVTYPEDHTRAACSIRKLVESGQYPTHLWK